MAFAINWANRLLRHGAIINEHFVPTLGLELAPYLAKGDKTAAQHLIRYIWSQRVIGDFPSPMHILDVACGSGYGSYMIAQAFPQSQVLGVDYDQAAVQFATQHYCLPNLAFKKGDVLLWDETIGLTLFDCILSFETLEHCRHREIMLQNLVNHLQPDGYLLFSTPSGHAQNILRPRWMHHAIEYSAASLYDFLSRYFARLDYPEQSTFPQRSVFATLDGTKASYLLRLNPVICRKPIRIANPYLGQTQESSSTVLPNE